MGVSQGTERGKWACRPGVGNFDDGEGHRFSTLTPEGHIHTKKMQKDNNNNNDIIPDFFVGNL